MGAMKAIHTDTEELVERVLRATDGAVTSDNPDAEYEVISEVGEYAHTAGWKSPTEMGIAKRRFMGHATEIVTAAREHGPDSPEVTQARAILINGTLEFFAIDWFSELLNQTPSS